MDAAALKTEIANLHDVKQMRRYPPALRRRLRAFAKIVAMVASLMLRVAAAVHRFQDTPAPRVVPALVVAQRSRSLSGRRHCGRGLYRAWLGHRLYPAADSCEGTSGPATAGTSPCNEYPLVVSDGRCVDNVGFAHIQ